MAGPLALLPQHQLIVLGRTAVALSGFFLSCPLLPQPADFPVSKIAQLGLAMPTRVTLPLIGPLSHSDPFNFRNRWKSARSLDNGLDRALEFYRPAGLGMRFVAGFVLRGGGVQ